MILIFRFMGGTFAIAIAIHVIPQGNEEGILLDTQLHGVQLG